MPQPAVAAKHEGQYEDVCTAGRNSLVCQCAAASQNRDDGPPHCRPNRSFRLWCVPRKVSLPLQRQPQLHHQSLQRWQGQALALQDLVLDGQLFLGMSCLFQLPEQSPGQRLICWSQLCKGLLIDLLSCGCVACAISSVEIFSRLKDNIGNQEH